MSSASKIMFGTGIALAVGAISAIFITMVGTQNQAGQQSGAQTQGNGAQQQPASSGQNLTAAGGQQDQGATTTSTITIPEGAAAQQVQQYYQPNPAQVQSGAQVTWQNEDTAIHTATARDGSFDTGNIQPGQSGSATVQGQGSIDYFCTIHPFMTATLQVISGGGGNDNAVLSQQAAQQQQQQQQNQTQIAEQQQQQPIQSPAVSNAVQQLRQLSPEELAQALQQLGQRYHEAATALQSEAEGEQQAIDQQHPQPQPNETSTSREDQTIQTIQDDQQVVGNETVTTGIASNINETRSNVTANEIQEINRTATQQPLPPMRANETLLNEARESVEAVIQRLENLTEGQ